MSELALGERLFMQARRWTAPLAALSAAMPPGRIGDIGCGHGALSELLARGRADREVFACDPDPRKVEWARQALAGLANVSIVQGSAHEALAEWGATLDAVVLADVLYLVPLTQWPEILSECRALLKPGGLLYLKEAEGNGSWKHHKCVLQERVMVQLLGRTHSSGALNLATRTQAEQALRASGFELLWVADWSRGYTTPHVLYVAKTSR